jgi:hypothetical protein
MVINMLISGHFLPQNARREIVPEIICEQHFGSLLLFLTGNEAENIRLQEKFPHFPRIVIIASNFAHIKPH